MRALLRNAGLLVVLLTAVLAEVLRVSFPLLYGFAEVIGFTTAAGVIPLLFALTLLAAPLALVAGPRGLLLAGAGGLAVARVVMQIQATPVLAVTLTGLLLGFVGLSAALRVAVARIGPLTAAAAVFLGLAIDTAIRLALVTWDAVWRHDAAAWAVGLALPLAVGVALIGVVRDDGGARWGADCWPLAAVPGPLLALMTLVLASPPFVAASGEVGLATAGVAVLIGLGLAAAAPAVRGMAAWAAWIGIIAVAAAVTGPTGLTGWLVVPAVIVGHVAVGALVSTAAVRADQAGEARSGWRTSLGAGLGALLLVATLMPYQISYDLNLLRDIPQFIWPAVAALALVLIVRSAQAGPGEPAVQAASQLRWVAALAPIPLLAVPSWLALTSPDVEPPPVDSPQVRVATYNIHSAVDWYGRLDPEQIAVVLESGGADVVMLQEVSRGWPIGGGLDSAAWLARRLGMEYAYGAAADNQFGNAVLADRPILDSWSARLDRGNGPMHRGYVGVTVGVGETTLDVWSTHLQHRDDTTATRQAQARLLLEEWDQRDRTVIGGDLNSRPDSEDIIPWFDGTDLVSAQDVAGDPAWNTSPALNPDHRIDWILGTPDLEFSDAAVPRTLASDHLPVFATVRVN